MMPSMSHAIILLPPTVPSRQRFPPSEQHNTQATTPTDTTRQSTIQCIYGTYAQASSGSSPPTGPKTTKLLGVATFICLKASHNHTSCGSYPLRNTATRERKRELIRPTHR